MTPSHFQGKKPLEHVIEARRKGKAAMSEIHAAELPGHYTAAADSAKETALLLVILWLLLTQMGVLHTHLFLSIFLISWLLFRGARSALLGWARLERLHRLIEEERWEIEHHRAQEKEELKALYAAKGFSGKLLDEAIEVLMADDNRLLQVMLEEELGLSLESFEHPLKQAAGSLLGVVICAGLMAFPLLFTSLSWPSFVAAAFVIGFASGMSAKYEKNRLTHAIVWNIAVATLVVGAAYFLGPLLVFSKS